MYRLHAEEHKNITVLRLTGQVVLPDVPAFSTELESHLLAENIREVALDLSMVECMDSSGLGVLISVCTKARSMGHRLILLTPSPHVAQLLKEAKIEGFFPLFESEEELKGYIPEAAE